jgi:5-methylcytosine-specific restriction protein A
MPITQGHGNPDWTRDETLLVLDLYLRHEQRVPAKSSPELLELSRVLNALPLHPTRARTERFRNAAGVYMKALNIHSAAGNASGKGLSNTRTDRAVWAEYGHRPQDVARLAALIRRQAINPEVEATEVDTLPDDAEFSEGRILSTRHYSRDRKARKPLLAKRLKDGALKCDCCSRAPGPGDSRVEAAASEAHHEKPLADGERQTRLSDVALLCATCHRMLHRAIQLHGRWMSVSQFRDRSERSLR